MNRIMVDLSATLIHHGHIRLIKKASKKGLVIIALTIDKEIKKIKGYTPELNYAQREEILSSIKYVHEIVPSPWLINESFLELHGIDYLVHGSDNSNPIDQDKLLIFPRTENISSTILRKKAYNNYKNLKNLDR